MISVLRLPIVWRRGISVLLHTALIASSNMATFWLRFEGEIPSQHAARAIQLLVPLIFIRLAVFAAFKLFGGLWKYTGLWDLWNIVTAVAVSSAIFYPVARLIAFDVGYPRSVVIIDAILLVCMMCFVRLGRRLYVEVLQRPMRSKRVLVYGAGDAGVLIVRDMLQNPSYDAEPIGFIDDDRSKVGQRIHGISVLGSRSDLEKIVKGHSPQEVLIAIPAASAKTIREILRDLEPFKLRITILPKIADLIGPVKVDQIRQLRVEDLLARAPIGLDCTAVRHFLSGKRVLVTGAGGSIGSELCRQIASANIEKLLLLDRYENGLFAIRNELLRDTTDSRLTCLIADITDERRIRQIFEDHMPNVVFHAAAHKHVPLMEENPCEAVKNNVKGTRLVMEAALAVEVDRFVLISTDKAVNPTSVMGATKRVAELMVDVASRRTNGKFCSVRFGNVLGSNGSVVPTLLKQIAQGGPVTVTHPEMKRYFMLIPEAVQLVLFAAAIEDRAPTFVLEIGDQVRIVDLARDLIRLSGFVPETDIPIIFSGIRPGEKLYEELVGKGEVCRASSTPEILAVESKVRPAISGDQLQLWFASLEERSAMGDTEGTLNALREVTTTDLREQVAG